MSGPSPSSSPRPCDPSESLRAVTDALQTMRFGVIQLTVHDGRLVQLDVTERTRFAQ